MKPYMNVTAFITVIMLLTLMAIKPATAIGIFMWKEINGAIVDASTNEPIEGVVVTASWILLPWGTSYPLRTLNALEAVTDSLGQYTLPGWGPKASLLGHLENDQPKLRFLKPGYVPLIIRNDSVHHPGLEGDKEHMIKEEITYDGDRKAIRMYEPEEHKVKFGQKAYTFKLKSFEGTEEEYIDLLEDNFNISDKYMSSLAYITSGNNCEWKLLPITFSTLHKLSAGMEMPKNRGWFKVAYLGGQDHCGNAEEYFKEYLK